MKINSDAENGNLTQIRNEVLKWLFKGDVGISSKSIASIVAELDYDNIDIPHDPSDFKRCLKMLEACPSIKNLSSVKERFPFFSPYVDNWNEMIEILDEDEKKYIERAPNLYKYMKKREVESLFIKGRVKDGICFVDVPDYEKKYNVNLTLDNIHEVIEKIENKEL